MTTIVVTRTSILADSLASGDIPYRTSKLRLITTPEGEMLTGGEGDLRELNFIVRLIENYGLSSLWKLHLSDSWPPDILKTGDTDVFVVTRDKQIWLVDQQLSPIPIEMDWYAAGSGGDFAKAALIMGKTPREAIEFACSLDPASKGPVDEIKFKRQKSVG